MKKHHITLIAGLIACGTSYAQNTAWPSSSSTDNVGIGTTTPESKLEIASPINGWMLNLRPNTFNPGEFAGIKIFSGYSGENWKWSGCQHTLKICTAIKPG